MWIFSGHMYTGYVSMNIDKSMDIHGKHVDMNIDGKLHSYSQQALVEVFYRAAWNADTV